MYRMFCGDFKSDKAEIIIHWKQKRLKRKKYRKLHYKMLQNMLNSVSSQCARDKSSIAQKLEIYPKMFKW